MNLAAIPRELVESTLFGHEKGAFTGALRQQIGKFELAHGGTLFLDEIGDLKFDLQAKLLRAIQEGEIERVGGGKPIKVQFRLIAATNVDLERAVQRRRVPRGSLLPHQRHPDPHPAAARAHRGSARAGAVLPDPLQHPVPQERPGRCATSTLAMLQNYWWPGNIRELENLVERLVATCSHDWITDGDLPFELQVADIDRGDEAAQPARPRADHLRAQLHHPRARAQPVERHADGALSRAFR